MPRGDISLHPDTYTHTYIYSKSKVQAHDPTQQGALLYRIDACARPSGDAYYLVPAHSCSTLPVVRIPTAALANIQPTSTTASDARVIARPTSESHRLLAHGKRPPRTARGVHICARGHAGLLPAPRDTDDIAWKKGDLGYPSVLISSLRARRACVRALGVGAAAGGGGG